MTDAFSRSYTEAAAKFVDAVRGSNVRDESVEHPERGADGESLYTHLAWVGPADAARVLVTISGTHGVEGFFGSAVQTEWLRRGGASLLGQGVAVLMVHALNPYGFSWLRRVNEENVDINRNWIDFSKPALANARYAALAEDLCPSDWTLDNQQRTSANILAWCATNGGPRAFQEAVSSGQWDYPKGLFFGGRAPSWSRRLLTEVIETRLTNARRVMFLDFHTGLGPYGLVQPIVHVGTTNVGFERTRRWIGGAARSLFGNDAVSAPVLGDTLSAIPSLVSKAIVDVVSLECGLQTIDKVAYALRADAWLHAYGDPGSAVGKSIKALIRQAFHSDDPFWQGMAMGQGLHAWEAALGELTQLRDEDSKGRSLTEDARGALGA